MLRNWNNRRRITSSRIRVVFRGKKGFDRKVKTCPRSRARIKFNSQLKKKKKLIEYLARFFLQTGVDNVVPSSVERFASYLRSNRDGEIVAKVPLRVRQVGKLCVFARSDRHSDKNSAKFNYASRRIDIARYLFVPVF